MKKLYLKTFGCQMNVYDSVRMKDALKPLGYEETTEAGEADLILINTCHIREKAAEKLYSEIGRLCHVKQARATQGKETIIVVAGCVVQAEGETLLSRAPAVDIAVGPQTYHLLPNLLLKYNRRMGRAIETSFPAESKFDFLPQTSASGASCYLAVQEGCDHFCSYCVVPYTRGCEYSRSAAEILTEARALVASGAKEITLLGQNVNCWHGASLSGKANMDLGDLIRELAEIDGLERIRYTTSYPSKITQNIISAHKDVNKLMPYIHLPVQSGSNAVLKAMNRLYTVEEYEEIVERFREARPDIAVSSDFIVGFPGETEKDFEKTMDVVRRVKYSSSYSFKFSPRPGTPASLMKNQVPEDVKTRRLMALQTLLMAQQKEAHLAQVGRVLPVLLTEKGRKKGQLSGYTPYLQPVYAMLPDTLIGQIVSLKITSATASALSSEIVSDINEKKQRKD